MTTKYYAKFLFPGLLFSESERVELKNHSSQEALKKMPKNAFAFELYDVETRSYVLSETETHDKLGDDAITKDKTVNRSGVFYPGGVLFTLEEVKSMGKKYSILASNMEGNCWDPVVKTTAGNFQPFEKNDVIL
jgi:hypothetical protein